MSLSNNGWTMNLTQEQIERVKALRKEDQTPNELMQQVFELGLYQLEYRRGPEAVRARKAYQAKLREQNRVGRELLKKAQTDPELAVKLGLGTRVEL